jgi:plasmid maintenance system antidote protein VapI
MTNAVHIDDMRAEYVRLKAAIAATIAPANVLLDALLDEQRLKNDAALARWLDVAPSVISKIRRGKVSITASAMISIHERAGMPISRIKALASGQAW